MKIILLDEFCTFRGSEAQAKKLKKKIQSFLKSHDDIQLKDAVQILDMLGDETDFSTARAKVATVAERLLHIKTLDAHDAVMAKHIVGYTNSYTTAHNIARKALLVQYTTDKIETCTNILFRLLRAKYFESQESQELTALFHSYFSQVMELSKNDNNHNETIATIRKGIFEQDHAIVDAGLTRLNTKGSFAIYKKICEEVNQYSAFSSTKITKLQLNMKVGANINKLRRDRLLKTEYLAKALDISPQYLNQIEAGKRGASAHNIYKLTQILQVAPSEILPGNIKPDPSQPNNEIKKLIRLIESFNFTTTEIAALFNMFKMWKNRKH